MEGSKMGLIQVAKDTISTMLKDQWREYFYCDSLANDVLMTKGTPKGNTKNNKGTDNIISNGSIVVVNEGQCMVIIDQGAVVDFCAEAGEFVYDTSTEPSLLYGNLGENVKKTFEAAWRRATFGGDTAKDQRVYYFNTKIIMDNKFGSASPIPFRIVDNNIGLDLDTSVKVNGTYEFRLADPLLFYKNVAGNVAGEYTMNAELSSKLKKNLVHALQPALAKVSKLGVRYSELTEHVDELADALREVLKEEWTNTLGIELCTINLSPITLSSEDEKMIKELQRTAVFRNAGMGAANLNNAQADAMKAAASNPNAGPMMAFAGMNMAQMAGGQNANDLYAMAAAQQAAAPQNVQAGAAVLGWKCPSCGHEDNRGKFCAECGTKKPDAAGWTCSCGTVNQGKFCQNCGQPKPSGAPLYKCDKCGWEPEDPAHPPKFCPQCGDPFDENDIKK